MTNNSSPEKLTNVNRYNPIGHNHVHENITEAVQPLIASWQSQLNSIVEHDSLEERIRKLRKHLEEKSGKKPEEPQSS